MTSVTPPDLVISFDLDKVLLPHPISRRVFPVVVSELAEKIARRQARPPQAIAEELQRRIEEEYRRRARDGRDPVAAYDWDSIFTVAAESLGWRQQVRLAPYVEALCRRPEDIPTYPGVSEGLARLQDLGARLLVVTNGYARYQVPILRALGLERFFERIATPDVTGYAKPQPGIFRWAFQGLAGRRNVHVGDWLLHDVYGAHQAGLEAVWFRRDLPDELAALPPQARLASPTLRPLIEAALVREGVSVEDPAPYWPDYVARDLDELPALLGLAGDP